MSVLDDHRVLTRPLVPHRLLPAALAVVFAAGALLHLGRPSLWFDEAVTASLVELGPGELAEALRADSGGHAVYYLFMRAWGALDQSELWLRLPSAIFAVASLLLFHRLAFRLLEQAAAVGAVVLFSVSPFLLHYAQEARGYSLLVLVVVALALAFTRAVETGTRAAWAAVAGLAVLALYTHVFSALVLVGFAVSLLALPTGAVPWRRAGAAAAAVAVAALPLAVVMLSASSAPLWWLNRVSPVSIVKTVLNLTLSPGVKADEAGYRAVFITALVAAAWLGGTAVVLAAVRRGRRSVGTWRTVLPFCWFAIPVVLLVGLSLFQSLLVPRYLIGAVPGACLLAGLGVSRLRPQPVGTAGLAAVAALSALMVVDRAGELRGGQDWRRAVSAVLVQAGRDDRVVFADPSMRAPFAYYAERMAPDSSQLTQLVPEKQWRAAAELPPLTSATIEEGRVSSWYAPYSDADLSALTAAADDTIWFVDTAYAPPWVSSRAVLARIESSHRPVAEETHQEVRLVRYEPRRS